MADTKKRKAKKMFISDVNKLAFLRSLEVEMRKRGKKPSQVAREMGRTPSWLSLILKGERGMDLFDFIRISEVLGASPQELLSGYPPSVPPTSKPNSKEVAALLNDLIPADVLAQIVELRKQQPDS